MNDPGIIQFGHVWVVLPDMARLVECGLIALLEP